MSKNQISEFRSKLLDKRVALGRRLGAIRSDRRHASEPLDPDFEEQAVQRENDETLDSLDTHGRQELAAIESALRRIEDGTFGKCRTCDEAISMSRLRVQPTAEQCIDCARARADR